MTSLLACVLLSFTALGLVCANAQARDEALLAAATAEQPAVVRTLERLVNIETGTGNAEGLAAMADLLQAELQALGAAVSRHPATDGVVGEIILGRLAGKGQRRVLLMAHMDTVYPKGTLARAPFRLEGNRAFGPGIADDKGGIAVILHALRLLQARGFQDFAEITVLVNTDEERGSNGSRALIEATARAHDGVLSFEPTVALREALVLATSGTAAVRATVRGRAAHAGAAPEQGINAMVEAADFMLRTLDLDDRANAFRFNWTVGTGGRIANMIPAEVTLEANVRYLDPQRLDTAMKTLRERAATPRLNGAQITVELIVGRPAFVADAGGRRLVDKAVGIYREIGFDLAVVPSTGGGTDAAYAARAGRPVIESLGLPGFGYHSDQAEYVLVDAIPRRLYLATRMIMDVALGR
ncbi:MAG: M20/M25/M40 family metallo-hydrolase [Betaproteobacteria bacterium]|nr:M20/M25/M40 family metallo-hydrolase [Betaproteobacteria bacterium]